MLAAANCQHQRSTGFRCMWCLTGLERLNRAISTLPFWFSPLLTGIYAESLLLQSGLRSGTISPLQTRDFVTTPRYGALRNNSEVRFHVWRDLQLSRPR